MSLDVTKMFNKNHGGIGHWVYTAGGEDPTAANYFDAMAPSLKVNDLITHLVTDDMPVTYYVVSITDGEVVLSAAGA